MKILALRTDWGSESRKQNNTYGGVGYYRSIKPSQYISKKHEVTNWGTESSTAGKTAEEQWTNIFTSYDVIWTTHLYNQASLAWMLWGSEHYKKPLIIDIDDDFLNVEKSHHMYDQFKVGSTDRVLLSTALSLCSAITVSTYPLKEMLHQRFKERYGIDKPIFVIPNMNDAKDWPAQDRPAGDMLTIAYSGSISHNADLKMVMPQLKRLMKKYPIKLNVLGVVAPHQLKEFFSSWSADLIDRTFLIGGTDSFAEFPPFLSKQPWDIGIAPLVDCPFNQKKSHIKWMEYGLYGIPTVASRVYPYYMQTEGRDVIVDGETGLLANDKREFGEKLEQLIVSEQLRKDIGGRAKEAVLRDWQYKDGPIEERFEKLLTAVL